ncbi:MAG: type II methionyl aminopeptidase [Candidatus Aenigmatarchaeota archaeon]|nr:MAG: type II methionyl aminopeptidase [Candidatus Aenigmarchaeota archaeon]
MEKEILEKYKKAGKINAEVKQEISHMLKPGLKILDLANKIEGLVKKKGARPAFPVNISINEVAAHYTPSFADTREIQEGELVKIDIGVHIDGYIGDMAFTYCSQPNHLIKASEKVLEKAIKIIKPGVSISEIGTTIENSAKAQGVGVIVNLTGHTLDKYVFHGPPSILNVKNNLDHKFKEWDVIALEPFITETNGHVKNSGTVEIYRYLMDRPVRLMEARKILAMARDEYNSLPFAKRWLYKKFSPIKVSLALRQLGAVEALETYPVLKEIENKPIAQSEHTIIVRDKPIITTKPVE